LPHASEGSLHAPPQQIAPFVPQAVHVPSTHVAPVWQVMSGSQHDCPAAPQLGRTAQAPATQTCPLGQSGQHAVVHASVAESAEITRASRAPASMSVVTTGGGGKLRLSEHAPIERAQNSTALRIGSLYIRRWWLEQGARMLRAWSMSSSSERASRASRPRSAWRAAGFERG
jgi:hypothetical protein